MRKPWIVTVVVTTGFWRGVSGRSGRLQTVTTVLVVGTYAKVREP